MNRWATFVDGSINYGMKARKNAAVFGFSASTRTPFRNAGPAPLVSTPLGSTMRASRHVLRPSQIR